MGGFGSGRGQHAKRITSDMQALDIRRLQRDGLLTPGRWFSWQWLRMGKEISSISIRTEADHVIFSYKNRRNSGEWQPMKYLVNLDWTRCNMGGQRPWFLCPAQGCGRRVAILFGGDIFACRRCHQLSYESQRETDDDRAARRADTIRRRLGWDVGIFNTEGRKPKGMHWRTFWRLKAEHDAFVKVALAGIAERLGLI